PCQEREVARKWNSFGVMPAAVHRWRRATPPPRATRDVARRTRAPRASWPSPGGQCRARDRSGRPTPPAAAGCGAARRGRARSCRLDSQGALLGSLELRRRCADRRRDAPLGEVALDQAKAEIVAATLG